MNERGGGAVKMIAPSCCVIWLQAVRMQPHLPPQSSMRT